jgi:hypothetical protein
MMFMQGAVFEITKDVACAKKKRQGWLSFYNMRFIVTFLYKFTLIKHISYTIHGTGIA